MKEKIEATKNILISVSFISYIASTSVYQNADQLMIASLVSAFVLSLITLCVPKEPEEDKEEIGEVGCSALVPCKTKEEINKLCDEKLAEKNMEIHAYQQELNCKITGQAVTIPIWLLDNCIFVLNDQSNRSKVAKVSLPYLLDRKANHERTIEGMRNGKNK